MMKEHSILFSDAEVRAALDGRKVQMRMPMRPQPKIPEGGWKIHEHDATGKWFLGSGFYGSNIFTLLDCPYGVKGDRLWVREAWAPSHQGLDCIYRADPNDGPFPFNGPWRPSTQMPRWASRLTLEITGVRVERLQDMTEDDAQAEGIRVVDNTPERVYSPPNYSDIHRDIFMDLWDAHYAKKGFGWDANPWVWCIEFRKKLDEDLQLANAGMADYARMLEDADDGKL